ncbi:MAG TPA: TetR family transcriptional regulator [Paracoccaceae bacterium]|nr:TetR family transcriptional regulator [Paracoccaceae bacterium]
MSENTKPRKRNAEATQARIIEVAREVFTEKGYDGARTRAIADRAGVNVALMNRYFGSKEGLFAMAVPPTLTIASLTDGPMDAFGARVASVFVGKQIHDGYDPTFVLIRSAASPEAVPILRKALRTQIIEPLAAQLGGEDALERACLIVALISGLDLTARVLGINCYSDSDGAVMRRRFAAQIQTLVDVP